MRSRKHSAIGSWIFVVCSVAGGNLVPVYAQALGTLSGSGELTSVSLRSDGQERQTLRQIWQLRLDRQLAPYLRLDARARLQRFDLDGADVPGSFQSQWQPGFEAEWSHPKLFLRGSYDHREEELSAADGLLLSDNTELSLRTRNEKGPILRGTFSLLERDDARSQARRKSRDRSAGLSAEWTRTNWSSRYSFTDRNTTNLVTDLHSRRKDHRLRLDGSWSRPQFLQSRLQVQTTLYATTNRDEVINGNLLFEEIPPALGLYARDLTPDTDPLPEQSALIDGDRVQPVVPPIDIGASGSDQNIGLDLGFARAVALVHLYTNRVSSDALAFDLYVSEDNVNWTRSGLVTSRFDRTQLRYELSFDSVETRYLKVVNRGGNEFADVLVTEIVAFEARDDIDTLSRTTSGGRVSARWSQRLSRRVSSSVEGDVVTSPGTSRVGRNNRWTWAARASFDAAGAGTHTLRWAQSFQTFATDRTSVREDLAGYSYAWTPSDRASLRSSADARFTRDGGRRTLSIYTASTQLQLDLLPQWTVGVTPAVTRRDDHLLSERSDQWSVGATTTMRPYQSFHLNAVYRHQQNFGPGTPAPDRDSVDLAADWQWTPSLQWHSRWQWIQDRDRTWRQDHRMSWSLSRRLRVAGSTILENSSDGESSFRYSLSSTVDFNRRTSAYLRISTNDLSRANGLRTDTFEQGLRTTF